MRSSRPRADRAEERFERFFGANYRPVRAYVSRRIADPSRVDDVVSDTFLVAWRRFGDVPGEDDIALLWILRIAHFTFLNAIRADERRRGLVARLAVADLTGHGVPAPEDAVDRVESRRRIADALLALPDADRDVLLLATWEGLSGAELAEVLACSVNAAWTRLSRARARFRDAYDGALAAAGGVA